VEESWKGTDWYSSSLVGKGILEGEGIGDRWGGGRN